MGFEIREANTKKEIYQFIDFAHDHYAGDPHYVPELFIAQKEMFDRKKYPFYEFGEVQCFMAYDGSKIVGRIAAIKNPRYNDYHKSNIGFFGFFEFINSKEVVEGLLQAAQKCLASENYDYLMGPTNFSTNETAGFLVDGFHEPPKIMMTYNKPYYDELLKSVGLTKEMDLYAYMLLTKTVSDKSIRLSTLLEERLKKRGITIRNISIKNFKQEVVHLKSLYNAAWENNWGFVPFTDSEFKHIADGMKMLADEDFAYMAEKDGTPIGFSISLPDINEVTKGFKKGRLLPFNIIKLLLNKKKTRNVRILAMGVIEEYRKLGIEAIFFAKNIKEARKRNLHGGEASWVLESNTEMVHSAEKLNGDKYKTYRLYKFPLH